MGLFKKKCEYCKKKIEKNHEVFRAIKDSAFVGTREKPFCCENHADSFEEESKGKSCGGGCCG